MQGARGSGDQARGAQGKLGSLVHSLPGSVRSQGPRRHAVAFQEPHGPVGKKEKLSSTHSFMHARIHSLCAWRAVSGSEATGETDPTAVPISRRGGRITLWRAVGRSQVWADSSARSRRSNWRGWGWGSEGAVVQGSLCEGRRSRTSEQPGAWGASEVAEAAGGFAGPWFALTVTKAPRRQHAGAGPHMGTHKVGPPCPRGGPVGKRCLCSW